MLQRGTRTEISLGALHYLAERTPTLSSRKYMKLSRIVFSFRCGEIIVGAVGGYDRKLFPRVTVGQMADVSGV